MNTFEDMQAEAAAIQAKNVRTVADRKAQLAARAAATAVTVKRVQDALTEAGIAFKAGPDADEFIANDCSVLVYGDSVRIGGKGDRDAMIALLADTASKVIDEDTLT